MERTKRDVVIYFGLGIVTGILIAGNLLSWNLTQKKLEAKKLEEEIIVELQETQE